jgi:hypothetical protein
MYEKHSAFSEKQNDLYLYITKKFKRRMLTAGVRINMYFSHISSCLSRTGQKSSWEALVNNLMVYPKQDNNSLS